MVIDGDLVHTKPGEKVTPDAVKDTDYPCNLRDMSTLCVANHEDGLADRDQSRTSRLASIDMYEIAMNFMR
jgi:hypothetical protein